MFKFFKDKIKSAVDSFSKKVEEEVPEEEIEVVVPKEQAPKQIKKEQSTEKKEAVTKKEPAPAKEKETEEEKITSVKKELAKKEEPIKEKEEEKVAEPNKEVATKKQPEKQKEEKIVQEVPLPKKEESTQPSQSPKPQEEAPKQGFFSKILAKKIDAATFEELFFELELGLLENNVALSVIEKIKEDLKKEVVDKPLPRSKIEETILKTLQETLQSIMKEQDFDVLLTKKPFVICLLGINGAGKTTSIAKLTKHLQQQGKSVVLAAADTFRAAAIDQLQEHADILEVKLIKHDYGSDPAAVAFDAIKHAKAKNLDVVLIDTAGRIHSNVNLLNELKKVIRIAEPDLKIFVGESVTGNDCVEQAQQFDEAVGIDGIILTKADVDEKGGTALSISHVTGKPIFFLGMGQAYEDLKPFKIEEILKQLGLEKSI